MMVKRECYYLIVWELNGRQWLSHPFFDRHSRKWFVYNNKLGIKAVGLLTVKLKLGNK